MFNIDLMKNAGGFLDGTSNGSAFNQMISMGAMPYAMQVGTAMGEAMTSDADLKTSLVKMQNNQMKEQLKKTKRKSENDIKRECIDDINEMLNDDSIDDHVKTRLKDEKMRLYSELIGIEL